MNMNIPAYQTCQLRACHWDSKTNTEIYILSLPMLVMYNKQRYIDRDIAATKSIHFN